MKDTSHQKKNFCLDDISIFNIKDDSIDDRKRSDNEYEVAKTVMARLLNDIDNLNRLEENVYTNGNFDISATDDNLNCKNDYVARQTYILKLNNSKSYKESQCIPLFQTRTASDLKGINYDEIKPRNVANLHKLTDGLLYDGTNVNVSNNYSETIENANDFHNTHELYNTKIDPLVICLNVNELNNNFNSTNALRNNELVSSNSESINTNHQCFEYIKQNYDECIIIEQDANAKSCSNVEKDKLNDRLYQNINCYSDDINCNADRIIKGDNKKLDLDLISSISLHNDNVDESTDESCNITKQTGQVYSSPEYIGSDYNFSEALVTQPGKLQTTDLSVNVLNISTPNTSAKAENEYIDQNQLFSTPDEGNYSSVYQGDSGDSSAESDGTEYESISASKENDISRTKSKFEENSNIDKLLRKDDIRGSHDASKINSAIARRYTFPFVDKVHRNIMNDSKLGSMPNINLIPENKYTTSQKKVKRKAPKPPSLKDHCAESSGTVYVNCENRNPSIDQSNKANITTISPAYPNIHIINNEEMYSTVLKKSNNIDETNGFISTNIQEHTSHANFNGHSNIYTNKIDCNIICADLQSISLGEKNIKRKKFRNPFSKIRKFFAVRSVTSSMQSKHRFIYNQPTSDVICSKQPNDVEQREMNNERHISSNDEQKGETNENNNKAKVGILTEEQIRAIASDQVARELKQDNLSLSSWHSVDNMPVMDIKSKVKKEIKRAVKHKRQERDNMEGVVEKPVRHHRRRRREREKTPKPHTYKKGNKSLNQAYGSSEDDQLHRKHHKQRNTNGFKYPEPQRLPKQRLNESYCSKVSVASNPQSTPVPAATYRNGVLPNHNYPLEQYFKSIQEQQPSYPEQRLSEIHKDFSTVSKDKLNKFNEQEHKLAELVWDKVYTQLLNDLRDEESHREEEEIGLDDTVPLRHDEGYSSVLSSQSSRLEPPDILMPTLKPRDPIYRRNVRIDINHDKDIVMRFSDWNTGNNVPRSRRHTSGMPKINEFLPYSGSRGDDRYMQKSTHGLGKHGEKVQLKNNERSWAPTSSFC